MRKKESIEIPNSRVIKEILNVLEQENMIDTYEEIEGNRINVYPLYFEDGEPVIENFIRVSKPGQRIYVSHVEITPVLNGRGISIVSTSSGVMTGAMAKSKNIGGELICKVW